MLGGEDLLLKDLLEKGGEDLLQKELECGDLLLKKDDADNADQLSDNEDPNDFVDRILKVIFCLYSFFNNLLFFILNLFLTFM